MIFVDTSVLVAATIRDHIHFQPSDALIDAHRRTGIAFSGHTLAEAYNTLSTYRTPRRIRPQEVYDVIERWQKLCTVVSLNPKEYLAFLREAAKSNVVGSAIYDALHIACARKSAADRIYTWNTGHFKAVAPDLAPVILEP